MSASDQNDVKTSFCCLYSKLCTDFTYWSFISMVDFEQVMSLDLHHIFWCIIKRREKYLCPVSGGHSEPSQTSKVELLTKMVNSSQPSTFSAKNLQLGCFSGLRMRLWILTQPAFTFSKLTIETIEQGVKYVHYNVDVTMNMGFDHF